MPSAILDCRDITKSMIIFSFFVTTNVYDVVKKSVKFGRIQQRVKKIFA
ncbi:hypothetical protein H6G76_11685 [Nostoc sp. FACHB-152]|nr:MULTISPECIES: hypothetical protein [unclassified Nostoc]MBD2447826.1 hypothetical protein [Nostoc sp. FACHB-152]MBD2468600.1 hypothetical protein [Nostoc sp. FACHB-145]